MTCPRCLDRVSRLTQAPPRAERPRDVRAALAGLAAVTAAPARHATPRPRRAAAEHVCRAVRAHRPRLLRVLVNGFEVGDARDQRGRDARHADGVRPEPVWLVEVYSEQDVCLASLDVIAASRGAGGAARPRGTGR